MSANLQADDQNVIDPREAIPDDHCVICQQPQTKERPISNWSFRLGSVNWIIPACPSCANREFGPYLSDAASMMPGSFRTWQSKFSAFVREHGRRVTTSQLRPR